MILASITSSPLFLAALRLSEGSSDQSGIPLWAVPIVIFIVLLLIFLSSYFTSSGIQGSQVERTAVTHDDPSHGPPATRAAIIEPAALQTDVAPTSLTEAPETAVVVPEEVETAVTISEEAEMAVVVPDEVETAVTVADEPPAPMPVEPDDLKKVEGIGPKIERILNEAGIATFAQLAAAKVSHLEKVVREDAGIRVAFPATWPEQAQLAAAGQWDTLEEFQDDLKGGRHE